MTRTLYFQKPKRQFSQNFLQDDFVADHIVQDMMLQKKDHCLEIGPGTGMLTKRLLPLVRAVDAVEIDKDMASVLKRYQALGQFRLHILDILTCDFSQLKQYSEKLRIVGNLPYHIATPILFHCIKFMPLIQDMHMMLQKEVAERLYAAPKHRAYGRLSVMIQYYFTVTPLLTVPNVAFYPVPRVHSQFVRLTPRVRTLQADNAQKFERLVRLSFRHKRKTLRNGIGKHLQNGTLECLEIDPSLRPEALSVAQFIALCNAEGVV